MSQSKNIEGKKLKLLIKNDGRFAKTIASLINVHENTLKNWYKREHLDPIDKERLKEIGIDIDNNALNNNNSQMKHVNNKADIVYLPPQNAGFGKKIPLIDMDEMNKDLHKFKDGIEKYTIDNINFPDARNSEAAWRVKGDAMAPAFKEGSIVIVKLVENWDDVNFGEPYYVRSKESTILRYIRKGKTEKTYLLVPENNKRYDAQERNKKDILEIFSIKAGVTLFSH